MQHLTLPAAHSRLGTAGLMHGCARVDTTTAHQTENSHSRLRLRSVTAHHASSGMFGSTHAPEASSEEAPLQRDRRTEKVYLGNCDLFKEDTAVASGNLSFLCRLKSAVP